MRDRDDQARGDQTRGHPDEPTAAVLKSDIEALIDMRHEVGLEGEYLWPIPPRALALLYRASAGHNRAIQIKAESAFGGGLPGSGAARIETLCAPGATEMFTALGLDLETYGNAFLQVIRAGDAGAGNDINREVITLYRILQRHYVPFIEMMRFQITARAEFERLVRTDPETLTDLERAARILYLQRTAYGGKISGRSFGTGPAGAVRHHQARADAGKPARAAGRCHYRAAALGRPDPPL